MASHNILIQGKMSRNNAESDAELRGINSGFTLIEILVAVGLLALIVSLGLILSMDFYRTYAFNYEKDLIVGLLQQARSKSMANINQSTHGVNYDSVNDEYITLEDSSEVQVFEANKSIEIDWPEEIEFKQLEGSCTCPSGDIEITLSGLGHEPAIIRINNEGRIDY